jgi:hypothetical protein
VQVLITRLMGSSENSLHLVVLSFDGYLYLIDGLTGTGLSQTPCHQHMHKALDSELDTA